MHAHHEFKLGGLLLCPQGVRPKLHPAEVPFKSQPLVLLLTLAYDKISWAVKFLNATTTSATLLYA